MKPKIKNDKDEYVNRGVRPQPPPQEEESLPPVEDSEKGDEADEVTFRSGSLRPGGYILFDTEEDPDSEN